MCEFAKNSKNSLQGHDMKLMIRGLNTDATVEGVTKGMEKLGPVQSVTIVPNKSEAATDCWAIVEMDITHERALKITAQVKDLWHDGQRVNISIMSH